MEGEPRHPKRRLEDRILDLVTNAPALNFKIVVGHPVNELAGQDIVRIPPPIRPGEKPQLTFYLTKKAWSRFLIEYDVQRGEEKSDCFTEVPVEFYKSPEESADGGASGGIGGLSADR